MLGVVQYEAIICGKDTCKCARGMLHHAYYHYFRDPLTHRRIKSYVPRFAVCKLKQRLRYWKNKYYFYNYMPGKTIAYAGVNMDNARLSLYYKRLHILTRMAKDNFMKRIYKLNAEDQVSYEGEFSGEPYCYLLDEKGTPAPDYARLLLKTIEMHYKGAMPSEVSHKMKSIINASQCDKLH